MPRTLSTIDPNQLAAVSGGATGRAAQDQRILDKLTSLTGAVKDVEAQRAQQKPDAGAAMMPIVAMAMMKKQGRL